jgi:hypothetical protein
MYKRNYCPIIGHRFSPWRKSSLTKQYLQQGYCQAQPIKARPWISPRKVEFLTSPVLSPPHVNAAAMSHKSPSKFLITTKARITVASHQKLNFHVILRLWLLHGTKDVSYGGNR